MTSDPRSQASLPYRKVTMSEEPTQQNPTEATANTDSTQAWYRAAMRSAYVAGAFLAIVCCLLMADYASRFGKDPLDTDAYRALRADVVADPGNLEAREILRRADQRLRQDYFRQRQFAHMGTWLAVAGCIVLIVSVKMAVTLHRRLPAPHTRRRALLTPIRVKWPLPDGESSAWELRASSPPSC